jgi:hypothetical protein
LLAKEINSIFLEIFQCLFLELYKDARYPSEYMRSSYIYTQENVKPVRKPQRRMNPILKDIVKGELKKLLDLDFIYPISDNQWVSPLAIFPKRNEKWQVCVDY